MIPGAPPYPEAILTTDGGLRDSRLRGWEKTGCGGGGGAVSAAKKLSALEKDEARSQRGVLKFDAD